MSDEIKKYLQDILDAITRIEQHVGTPRIFENYTSDQKLKDSVERNIITIGEALNQSLRLDDKLPISYSIQIIGTRNKLVHGYDELEDDIIWKIVINYLPLLKSEVEALLRKD